MIAFGVALGHGGSIMNRHATGAALAERLYAAEAAIDRALSETAHLVAMLPAARAQAYLSAPTGQRAFDGAAAAVSALTSARSHIVDTHNVLAALARRMGLDTLAAGALDKPEDRPPVGGEGARGHHAVRVNEGLPFP